MDPEAVAALAGERVPHGSSDDPGLLDFSANCNPRVPAGVESVYAEAFDAAGSYAADDYPAYRDAAAAHVGCERSQVVATPGGLAALRLAFEITLGPDDRALVPAPTFGEYDREIRLQGATTDRVDYDAVLECDPGPYRAVVVCNPNNPTGDAYESGTLRAFAARCRDADTVLVVDEAFLGFTELESLAGEPGVIVARSLTKLFGLPGLRAGFAVASGDLRDRLASARRTWALGTPAARVGAWCLDQREFVAETCDRVASERRRIVNRLPDGLSVVEPGAEPLERASAPFLLLDAGSGTRVDELLAGARDAGVVLRDARTFEGLDSHVRVAVRLPEENDQLCEVLADV